jgi:DNA-binding NarL/FixJ family response regulator
MNSPVIRLLIVDDHFMVRMGLMGALAHEPDMRVVGEAGCGEEALRAYVRLRPDVTLMDGVLPDVHGVEVTRGILALDSAAKIILVSINETGEDIHRAMKAGALGYLPKSAEQSLLVGAIRAVAQGLCYLPDELKRRLADRNLSTPLSGREVEVLGLVARGLGNKEIALRLGVGEGTVKTHLKHALAKLGAADRTHAVTLALERGVLRRGGLLSPKW